MKSSKLLSSFAYVNEPRSLKIHNQYFFRKCTFVKHIDYKLKRNAPVSIKNKNLHYLQVAFNNKNRDSVDHVEK